MYAQISPLLRRACPETLESGIHRLAADEVVLNHENSISKCNRLDDN